MLEKGSELELTIDSMSHGSAGIARHDGFAIFLDNVCPGDKVLAEVYDHRKSFAMAKIKDLLEPSSAREPEPKCKLHKVCGGCQWQQINYKKQLEYKRKNIVDLFTKEAISGFEPSMISPALGMEGDGPWSYRNKVIFPVDTVKSNGRLKAGYYVKNTHDLINIKHCPIQYSIFDEVMEQIKEFCSKHGIAKPLLRHIALRANHDQSELLITFIVRRKEFKNKLSSKVMPSKAFKDIARLLSKKFPQLKGVSLNFNDFSTNVILGELTETIAGQGYITDEVNGIKFKISPTSFFQVNNQQAAKLMEKVYEFSDLSDGDTVLDAYAGIGTFSIFLAKKKNIKLTAVEVIKSAVEDGKSNAELNSVERIEYHCSKLEDFADKFESDQFKTLVVNPPRKGCTNKVLDSFGKISPERIVYVSCNPATLARDIKYMEQFGFKLEKLQPIDLFPHTYHIESVALLNAR